MGKWFNQAAEIEKLRKENQRLLALVERLKTFTGADASTGVSAEERQLIAAGKKIQAIKLYRERTGADLLTAKNAIDSV